MPDSIVKPIPESDEAVGAVITTLEILGHTGEVRARVAPGGGQQFAVLDVSSIRDNRVPLREARAAIDAYVARSPEGAKRVELTSQALDAFAMPSWRGFRARVALLPVTKAIVPMAPDQKGNARTSTTYLVRGIATIRVEQVWPRGEPVNGGVAASGSVSFDELPCYEDCPDPGGEGEGYATQEDRDAALAAAAVIVYEAESVNATSEAEEADFDAWWELNYGSLPDLEYTLNGESPCNGVDGTNDAISLAAAPNPCVAARTNRIGAWGLFLGAVVLFGATVINPEPVTKTLMAQQLGTLVIMLASEVGVIAAHEAVRECHRQNRP